MTFTKEEKIKILQETIQIKSENDNEAEVAQYIQEILNQHEIESELVEYQPGRASLVASIPGQNPDGKVLVLSGHLDTVSAGDHEEWTYPPFGAEIHDGKIYGRGSTDMKAGLCALVLAAIEIKEEGADFAGEIRLALTVGEEIGMLGSKQLVEEGYVDGADGFLIGEPTSAKNIVNSHKGSIQYEIIAKGRTAHSSMPELGADALQLMVDYINESNQRFDARFNHPDAENDQLGRTLNVNTVIEGGTQINSVASHVSLLANARVVPEASNDVVVQIIEETIADLNEKNEAQLELNMMQNNPSATSPVDNDLVQALLQAAGEGTEVIPLMGATDASNFGRLSEDYDLAIFGPGETETSHQIDEHVLVDDYLQFIDIYKQAIVQYLKASE